jgi:calcium-dependent protein kinase
LTDILIEGSGHFGIVRVASLISNPNKKYAVKSIQKDKMQDDLHLLRRELEILKNLDHPNIVKFYETY